ncbi:efflux RND transporter periplasmic adaptor subunit [Sphingobacterium sp. SYP-B4668]|uniref:efflux RND transporter periplasmic adaptor subunit n=1 Tax=Sphingobacterium sp. SYP-B4668 TaxID=2996035 RepID=UPI0022DDE29F|nr:efflux RND transporter periplasmic adaptor subunit [Sphingobacterium sp. SYP-B4668]
MNQVSIVKSSLMGISAVFLFGCSAADDKGQQIGQPVEVNMLTIAADNAIVAREYSSAIEGILNVEIRAQVSGYIQKIMVDEGAYVQKGQTLFKIDDQVYVQQYNNAKASVLAAKANLVNMKIDLDRKRELVENNIVSNLQVSQAEATYEATSAALEQAKAAEQSARINIGFCNITAPVSGYIGRIPYRLGSLIGPSIVSPLTILSDTRQVYAYFSMSEKDFSIFQDRLAGNTIETKLRHAAAVQLKTATGKIYSQQGKINAVEGQFDKNTGSITLRAVFDNPGNELRTGSTGRVLMEQHYEQAVLVPISSTIAIQDKIYVFTSDKEGKAVQQPLVVSGKTNGNYIVTEGIQAGEKIVANGLGYLQAGTPIKEKSDITDSSDSTSAE